MSSIGKTARERYKSLRDRNEDRFHLAFDASSARQGERAEARFTVAARYASIALPNRSREYLGFIRETSLIIRRARDLRLAGGLLLSRERTQRRPTSEYLFFTVPSTAERNEKSPDANNALEQ